MRTPEGAQGHILLCPLSSPDPWNPSTGLHTGSARFAINVPLRTFVMANVTNDLPFWPG